MKSLRANLTALILAIAISVGVRAIAADISQSDSASREINVTEPATTESSAAASNAFPAIAGTFGAAAGREKQGWDIIAESLFLWRDNHTPAWVAGDFDMGVGPRIIVTREVNDEWAWDAEYFGVFGMQASATQSGAFESPVFGSTEFGDNVRFVPVLYQTQQKYESNLNNVELNAVRKGQSISLLAGFRYLRFEEQYRTDTLATMPDLSTLPGFGPNDVTFRLADTTYTTIDSTENNLMGGQLGLRWRRDWGRLFCDTTGKAGLFGNVYKISDEPTKSNTAFVGDLSFSAGLHVNEIWSVRAGYNLLWINDVALAPRQVLTSVVFPTRFNPDDRVFLHGASAGLEAAW